VNVLAKEIWNREDEFEKQLLRITPAEFPAFLKRREGELIRGERPWAAYMRAKFKEKGVLQQEVFLAADLSERYGYKLIAEEKHTTQRDVILRLCLAAQFRLDETQEALILYGMAPLLGRIPRDAAFIVAFQNRICDIHDVDAILRENDLPPFLT
jgi:hypothetical protein